MLEIYPGVINPSQLRMVCNNCGFESVVYLTKCSKCDRLLTPVEIKKYLKFKVLLAQLKDENYLNTFFKDTISNAIFLKNYTRVQSLEIHKFFLAYFNYYYSVILYEIYSRFYTNFKQLLRLAYLYDFNGYLSQELQDISEKLRNVQTQKEKYVKVKSIMERFNDDDTNLFLKLILFEFSERLVLSSNISLKEQFLNEVFFNTFSNLYETMKVKDNQSKTVEQELLLRLKEYLYTLTKSKEEFEVFPLSLVDCMKLEMFPQILLDFQLELIFLPHHDKYVLIKSEYPLPLDKIKVLQKQEGGSNLRQLSEVLKVPLIEAEMIIQLILKRKLGLKTESYLRGEELYVR